MHAVMHVYERMNAYWRVLLCIWQKVVVRLRFLFVKPQLLAPQPQPQPQPSVQILEIMRMSKIPAPVKMVLEEGRI